MFCFVSTALSVFDKEFSTRNPTCFICVCNSCKPVSRFVLGIRHTPDYVQPMEMKSLLLPDYTLLLLTLVGVPAERDVKRPRDVGPLLDPSQWSSPRASSRAL